MFESTGYLEQALVDVESSVAAALKEAASVTKELKKAKAAAGTGQIKDLRRALESAEVLAGQLADSAGLLRRGFEFDEVSHMNSGAYSSELLETARSQGVSMFEEDERLLCYPSLVKVIPVDAAIEVDRKRDKRLRPSVVIRLLKQAQERGPSFKPEPFLEALASAYDLVVTGQQKGRAAVVRVQDIWSILTLLPGQSREYSKQEFARDLYLLDQSGCSSTRDGRQLSFHASTGTKGAGTLTTVARNGQPQRYWGASFE
ncbi:MAG: hypothetical protein ACT4OM_01385 [Actinomycetota bacterium]